LTDASAPWRRESCAGAGFVPDLGRHIGDSRRRIHVSPKDDD
jgi:hypothetical protein